MENQPSQIELIIENPNSMSTVERIEEDNHDSSSITDITSSSDRQTSSRRESDNDYKKCCLRLYRAAIKGDWESAAEVLLIWPDLVRDRFTDAEETILHIAALAGQVEFARNLVEKMRPQDLEIRNSIGSTALCYAALGGSVSIAEAILSKNDQLAIRRASDGPEPLYMAALSAEKEMLNHLYGKSDLGSWSVERLARLFITCIRHGLLDVALRLIKEHQQVTLESDVTGDTALHVLARMPLEFAGATQQRKWRRFINSFPGMKEARDQNGTQTQAHELLKCILSNISDSNDLPMSAMLEKTAGPLFIAADFGNTQFLVELIDTFPDLRWIKNQKGYTIFHIAILKRHAKIFNLLHNTGFKKVIASYRDQNEDNMLHLAARLAPPTNISGEFFQMQHEMLWFKEVEKTVDPLYRKLWNLDGETPGDLFSKNHRTLKREGEKWIKGVATSSTAVATLVVTVVFTVVSTMSGFGDGKDKNYQKNKLLPISEVVALLFSSISMLIFLSFHTSHYVENHFLLWLPLKLLCGMTTLCISLAAMMLLFCIGMHLSYRHGVGSIKIIFGLLSPVPAVSMVIIFPLLVKIIRSIYVNYFLFSSKRSCE